MQRLPARQAPTSGEGQDADHGLRLRAFGYGVLVAGLTCIMWFVIATRRLGFEGMGAVAFAVAAAAACGTLASRMAVAIAGAAGALANRTMAGGSATPYDEQFSYQEAMAARGDVAGALESYEEVLSRDPVAVAPRLKAAELYARRGDDPVRAAALLREARDLPTATPREALYAALRLVDLYEGKLNDPGRALVEMRRIVERYPDSDVAAGLRQAIARIKSDRAAQRETGE